MKRFFIVVALAAILAAGGCTKNFPDKTLRTQIQVGIDAGLSKISLGEEKDAVIKLLWSEGDEIAVVDGMSKSVYRLSGGAGTALGTFEYVSGDANPEVITDVVFPASAEGAVPLAQTYCSGSFDPAALTLSYHNPSATKDSPIVLSTSSSVLCFSLCGSDRLTSIKVAVKDGSTYSLSVPSVQLSQTPSYFYVVVPSLADKRVDVTFNGKSGQMTRILAAKSFIKSKMHRFATIAFRPDRNVRILTYNVGQCSKSSSSSPEFIAEITKELNADIAVMNEVKSSLLAGYQDKKIANALGWNYYYKEAQNNLGNMITYGSSAGTKISESYLSLPNIVSEEGKYDEDRVCLFMEFEDFVLAGTHIETNDFVSHSNSIMAQVTSKYAGKGKPVILCGDMNTRPYSVEMKNFLKEWRAISRTDLSTLYNADLPNSLICIDYIFVWKGGPDVSVLNTQVCRSVSCGDIYAASDHFPVYVDVVLGGSSLPLLENNASSGEFTIINEQW